MGCYSFCYSVNDGGCYERVKLGENCEDITYSYFAINIISSSDSGLLTVNDNTCEKHLQCISGKCRCPVGNDWYD